jgi:hypothetical protein
LFVDIVIFYWANIDDVAAVNDFIRNYKNMRDANTIGGDKYFHCMANCEAASRGSDGTNISKIISESRELFDEYVKNNSAEQCNDDRKANNTGRNSGSKKIKVSCTNICSGYRPNGLPLKY